MVVFALFNILVAAVLYLCLALGVDLIARFAPPHRKPIMNAALLATVVILFLFAAAVGALRF